MALLRGPQGGDREHTVPWESMWEEIGPRGGVRWGSRWFHTTAVLG